MKSIKREVVRLSDMAMPNPLISDTVFQDCIIVGPAVLAMTGDGGEISGCSFDADPSALLWEIPDERREIVGAIEARSCKFQNCKFSMVGFAGPKEFAAKFKGGLQG